MRPTSLTVPRERDCGVRVASLDWWSCRPKRLKATLLILTLSYLRHIKTWPMRNSSTWSIIGRHLTYITKYKTEWLTRKGKVSNQKREMTELTALKIRINKEKALILIRNPETRQPRGSDIWRGPVLLTKSRSRKRYKKELPTWCSASYSRQWLRSQ